MRKYIKLFFICILITGMLSTPSLAQSAYSRTTKGNQQKVIAIVLDDSTSMVRDDPGKSESDFTTRWVEADYSVRALSAMMNSGDILRVYPLNESGYFSVRIGTDKLEKTLFNKLDSMGYSGGTQFNQVQAAAEYLKNAPGQEHYLVVITDGNFKKGNGNDEMTQAELDEAFASILTPAIKTHYIQIGKLGSCLPSDKSISIHYNESQKVTKQITDVINEIYHRVAMEDGDKKALITYPSEDSLTVNFNIPIQRATIFLQGDTDWSSGQHKVVPYDSVSTPISPKDRETLTLWKTLDSVRKEWIKTSKLSGLVINCSIPSKGSMEAITISDLPGLDRDSIQVYYEPAVEQQVTITQRDGMSFVYGQLDPPLFVEGPIDISIDYQGKDGKALDLNAASMLKSELTTVEVNGRLFSAVRQEDGRYVYSGVLSAADAKSSIAISNAIGLDGGKRLIPLEEIHEPNMVLALELVQDYPELMLDGTGSTVLSVAIYNEAAGAPPEWNSDMVVECTSKHFTADVNHYVYKDGVIQIPLALKDVEEHQLDLTERFTVKVSVPYSDSVRPPESVERVLPAVPVTSEPHELFAELENTSAKLIYVAALGKTFPITCSCDGKPLTEEQMQDAVLSLTLQNKGLDKLITLKNGSICLKSHPLQWLSVRDGEYEAELTFSYTKWNQPAQISVPITLSLSPITWWHILCFILFVIAVIMLATFLIWFFFWYVKWTETKNGDYINWKTTFELVNQDDPMGSTLLEWSLPSKIFFRANFSGNRSAHIRRRVRDDVDDAPLPIRIDFYVAREGEYWILKKIGNRMRPALDECELRIGGVQVSQDNCRFLAGDDYQNKLEFKRPNYTHSWYLRITENE